MRAPRSGFTLIEVLVALAIIAVALGASIRATGVLAQNNADLRLRVLAQVSAENRLAELKAARLFPPLGRNAFECSQGRAAFRCEEEVKSTPNPAFRRIEVRVYLDEADGRGNASRHRMAELIGILPNLP